MQVFQQVCCLIAVLYAQLKSTEVRALIFSPQLFLLLFLVLVFTLFVCLKILSSRYY